MANSTDLLLIAGVGAAGWYFLLGPGKGLIPGTGTATPAAASGATTSTNTTPAAPVVQPTTITSATATTPSITGNPAMPTNPIVPVQVTSNPLTNPPADTGSVLSNPIIQTSPAPTPVFVAPPVQVVDTTPAPVPVVVATPPPDPTPVPSGLPILRSAFPSLSFLYSILTNIKLNVGDSQKPSDWIGGMTTFINWAYLPENGAVIGLNDSLPYTLDYFWAAFTPWAKSHGFAGLSGMRGLGAMRFTVGAV